MRNPNTAICRKQDTEDMEVKDYDVSNITLTTRMMSTLEVIVEAKLHCNDKTVITSQCYKIIEDSQHDTTVILHYP